MMLFISDTSLDEGITATFTVTLDAASGQTITVDYSTSGTLTFTAGMTETIVTVSTTDDEINESNEIFTVTLSNATNTTISDTTAIDTFIDDDPAPLLTLFHSSNYESSG